MGKKKAHPTAGRPAGKNENHARNNSCGAAAGVMNRPPRVRVRVVCHTEVLNEPKVSALPPARVCASGVRAAALAAWRTKTFGGDYDPVRAAVDDAVGTFSGRQPEADRLIWLKVANEIGWQAFLELYYEQKSILDEALARGRPLRDPAAAFQKRLNRHTGHGNPATTVRRNFAAGEGGAA